MSSKYLYYIVAPEFEAVKIGYSSAPRRRLKDLQTANFADLILAAVEEISGENPKDAETHTWFQFHADHLRGEWFRLSADLDSHVRDVRQRHVDTGRRESTPCEDAIELMDKWQARHDAMTDRTRGRSSDLRRAREELTRWRDRAQANRAALDVVMEYVSEWKIEGAG